MRACANSDASAHPYSLLHNHTRPLLAPSSLVRYLFHLASNHALHPPLTHPLYPCPFLSLQPPTPTPQPPPPQAVMTVALPP